MVLIYHTAPNINLAEKIAETLVQDKLVACVNILPGMRSVYSWEEQIQKEQEVVLILKTKASQFSAIEKKIKSIHPYECPCLIQISVENVNSDYLNWIKSSLYTQSD